jgi:uncharacterized protein YjbI with pentapeptide repeats
MISKDTKLYYFINFILTIFSAILQNFETTIKTLHTGFFSKYLLNEELTNLETNLIENSIQTEQKLLYNTFLPNFSNDKTYEFINNSSEEIQDYSGCDLSGCDLSGCDLSGCDLSGCDLSGCDLSGCDLSGCDLSGCDLSGCDISEGCSLRYICNDLTNCDEIYSIEKHCSAHKMWYSQNIIIHNNYIFDLD